MKQTWLEIDVKTIEDNCRTIIKTTGVDLMPVLKSNAYGHGIIQVARACEQGGAKMLAVVDFDDALQIRQAGISLPILLLNPVNPEYTRQMIENDFIASVSDSASAKELNEKARYWGKILKVNFKFDTGLHRFGIQPDRLEDFLKDFDTYANLNPEGVYSHFADQSNKEFTKKQIDLFKDMLFQAAQVGYTFSYIHLARSETLDQGQIYYDIVRPGLAIYGICTVLSDLKPTLSFKTTILAIKKISAGANVGYELAYQTKKETTIAILATGYADGYDKRFSNKTEVIINYKKCPVVGNVCMNHTIVDVSDINCQAGDEAILIGKQGEIEISVLDLEEKTGVSAHEILARLPKSIQRMYNSKEGR